MNLSHQELKRRSDIVYLKKEERNYYDLEITPQHLEVYETFLAGELDDQAFTEKLIDLIPK